MDTFRDEFAKEVRALSEENRRLRKALEFYAKATTNDFTFERGNLARKTLETCPTTQQKSQAN